MFRIVKNLLTSEECKELYTVLKNHASNGGDVQVPGSIAHYSPPCANILLGLFRDKFSEESGKRLLPCYSYCRIYKKGNELKKHVDRPACEYSATLNLYQSDEWPIFMNGEALTLATGDACLYEGCKVEHWREPFSGTEYVQIFLHYVDADGPHTAQAYDAENAGHQQELRFRFENVNFNLDKWWRTFCVFSRKECDQIIDNFSLGAKEKALVGDVGRENTKIRQSEVMWIPKTSDHEWIYLRIMNVIGEANSTFFNMDITEILEDVQYTEYDSEYSGHYDWHIDVGGQKCARKLSISIQLSDPSTYDGGELQFDHEEPANTEKGCAIVFPSYKRHRVTPVTRGKRCALVVWIAGPPLR